MIYKTIRWPPPVNDLKKLKIFVSWAEPAPTLGTTRSGACGSIWLNTGKLTRSRHSKATTVKIRFSWFSWCRQCIFVKLFLHWWRGDRGTRTGDLWVWERDCKIITKPSDHYWVAILHHVHILHIMSSPILDHKFHIAPGRLYIGPNSTQI